MSKSPPGEVNIALEAARDAAQLVLRENPSDLAN